MENEKLVDLVCGAEIKYINTLKPQVFYFGLPIDFNPIPYLPNLKQCTIA